MKKSLFMSIAIILSATMVFAIGKVKEVDAVDNPATSNISSGSMKSFDYSYYHKLRDELDKAKTREERNEINLKIITGPVSDFDQDSEMKYDALFELMSGSHSESDVRAVVEQIFKEKTWTTKKDMLDALSYSTYKDITSAAYKKIAETDDDVFIRGLATHFYIKLENEGKGIEMLENLFEYMDKNNELAYYYNGVDAFRDSEKKEEVKQYLVKLKDDQHRGDVIRSYAAIICHQKYKTELAPYYPLIKRAVLDKNLKESAAKYFMGKLKILSNKNIEAKSIMDAAVNSGNGAVKNVLEKMNK